MADVMRSEVVAIGISPTVLVSAPAGAGSVTVVNMLQIGNVDGTDPATVSLYLNKNDAGDVPVIVDVEVGAGKAVIIYSDANGKLTLENLGIADVLKASASAAGDLTAVLSYVTRTN